MFSILVKYLTLTKLGIIAEVGMVKGINLPVSSIKKLI